MDEAKAARNQAKAYDSEVGVPFSAETKAEAERKFPNG
jgi:hypothetical protein